MNSKEYTLPSGKKVAFTYDVCGIGKVTLECMDELMGMIADRPQEWIPCSERLPDYMIAVLTWDGMAYAVEKRIPYITDEDGEHIMSEWWVSDDFDEENTEYYPNLRDGAAIAWMPLPEPWKGENNE